MIVSGGAGQLVAAVGAAGADDEARLAQADDELLEVGAREVLLGGDLGEADAGPVPKWRPSWTIRRTPYSPFVLKAMAPLPWNVRRGASWRSWRGQGSPSYPSDFVGYSVPRRPVVGQSPLDSRGPGWGAGAGRLRPVG